MGTGVVCWCRIPTPDPSIKHDKRYFLFNLQKQTSQWRNIYKYKNYEYTWTNIYGERTTKLNGKAHVKILKFGGSNVGYLGIVVLFYSFSISLISYM